MKTYTTKQAEGVNKMQFEPAISDLLTAYADSYDKYTTLKLKADREEDSEKQADLLNDLIESDGVVAKIRAQIKTYTENCGWQELHAITTEIKSIHECN